MSDVDWGAVNLEAAYRCVVCGAVWPCGTCQQVLTPAEPAAGEELVDVLVHVDGIFEVKFVGAPDAEWNQ